MVTISNGTAEIAFLASHLHDSRQDLIRSVATFKNILLSSKDITTLKSNSLSLYFTILAVKSLTTHLTTHIKKQIFEQLSQKIKKYKCNERYI